MKTTKSTRFLNQHENNCKFSFKFNRGVKTQKHDTCKTRIQQDFITRMKQNKAMTKQMYPKLVFNKQKKGGNSSYIYTYWAHSSRKFLKKFSTYMWPMFTQMWPMCTQDSTKND